MAKVQSNQAYKPIKIAMNGNQKLQSWICQISMTIKRATDVLNAVEGNKTSYDRCM